jgi:hypothetical protein
MRADSETPDRAERFQSFQWFTSADEPGLKFAQLPRTGSFA